MNAALIITTYNRPEYLARCFESLLHADLSQIGDIIIVDDASTDKETIRLINNFEREGIFVRKFMKHKNEGIKRSLIIGFEHAFNLANTVINLDGDAIVKKDFVNVLLDLKSQFPFQIISGFNTTVQNRNPILLRQQNFFIKKYASGINMCINKVDYTEFVKPGLESNGNWDFQASVLHLEKRKGVVVARPSVVQHIGIVSSMGHGITEEPDVAEDFFLHELPSVTLIGASTTDLAGLRLAADISTKYIKFGAVKLLSSEQSSDPRAILIKPLLSKEEYNKFVLKEIVNYIDTDFFIIFQPDGFIINPLVWTDDFFDYDVIGALWKFREHHRVGNGGFCFRSRHLHEILRDDPNIIPANDHLIQNFEEDHNIGFIYRAYLETKHSIRFASEEICERFSVENYGVQPPNNKYNGSFGFHSFGNIDWSGARLEYIPYKKFNT